MLIRRNSFSRCRSFKSTKSKATLRSSSAADSIQWATPARALELLAIVVAINPEVPASELAELEGKRRNSWVGSARQRIL
jgi:hypothetical protein